MHILKSTVIFAVLVVSTLSQEEQIVDLIPTEPQIDENNHGGDEQIVEGNIQEDTDVEHQVVEHKAHPKYEFKYGVKDTRTQDIKEQAEIRDGHKVAGYYKLVESDGTTRTVHYSSDKHTGFQAQVDRAGLATHPASQKYNYEASVENRHLQAQDGSHHTASSYINYYHH